MKCLQSYEWFCWKVRDKIIECKGRCKIYLSRLTSLLFCRVTHSFFSKLWYSKWHKILLTFSKIKIEIINFSSVDLTSRLLIVCLTHLTLLTYDPIPTYQSLGSGTESHPIPLLFYWLHLTFVNSLFDTLDSVNISCSYIWVIEEWGQKSFCEAEIPELLHKKQEQQKI